MSVSRKYQKDIEEIHRLYFSVSCDREKLIKYLNGDKSVPLWTELEDLALKDRSRGLMYNHVLKTKGEKEVEERMYFLEIE